MPWWIYAGFLAVILALILIDLCVLNRKQQTVTVWKALGWTAVWISLALLFNCFVYLLYSGSLPISPGVKSGLSGMEASMQFFTGYLVEYSLSVDNIFVIALIITTFSVPSEHQHRLLFWGVMSAAVLRGLMIAGGATLMAHFEWTIYLFGALLIFSALKMLTAGEEEFRPEESRLVRLTRRFYPVTTEFAGNQFLVRQDGRWVATPMLLALVMIESTDVIFAVDSIPAVFAITQDPFLVLTSNIFAVLGLRSLYFALAGLMEHFHYLKTSLVVLLLFVGGKMLLSSVIHIPNIVSMLIILGILGLGVAASLLLGRKEAEPADEANSDYNSRQLTDEACS
jgi:tellurite resistance protein TerC